MKGEILMNTYKNISNELKAFFSSHPIFKILLPIDLILLFGGLAVMILNQFIGIGDLLYSIAYYAFFLGLLLAYANFHQQYLYIGFFGYAVLNVLVLIKIIFGARSLSFYSLVTALIFAGVGYLIFKNCATSSSSQVNKTM